MKLSFCVALLCLASCAWAVKLSDRIAPRHHVEAWTWETMGKIPGHLPNAMHERGRLVFETQRFGFDLNLDLFAHLYKKDAEILAEDEEGKVVKLEPQHRSYHGTGAVTDKDTAAAWDADVSVTFYRDGRFHAVVVTDEDTYTVDVKELADRLPHLPFHGQDKGHEMTMVRQSDVLPEGERAGRAVSSKYSSSMRKLQGVDVWYDCAPGLWEYQRAMYVGIVTDDSFNQVYGNSQSQVQSAVEGLFTDQAMNTIYTTQMNIRLMLGDIKIGSSAAGFTFDTTCRYDINSRLDKFSAWREDQYNSNQQENHGLWHLLTNCHAPPGTVGLAWVGVLCSIRNGCGVSNYINEATSFYGTGTWHTIAHEIGHNFGAGHTMSQGQGTTGGIMDYGDGKYPVSTGDYQFHPDNQNEVCNELKSSMDSSWSRSRYLIPLDQCYHTYQTGTPSPTYPPVPAPTASPITPAPVKAGATPPPTPRPVVPTPAPVTVTDDGTYKWMGSNNYYTTCFPECGENSYKTQIVFCYQQVGPWSWQSVDEVKCDSATKPQGEQVKCEMGEEVPSCTPTCGDGFVSSPEVCDTKTERGECCASDCSAYIESEECFNVNPVIDAAFSDDQGRVYLFQGKYYARYASYSQRSKTNKPDAGFPKLIANSFKLSSFSSDISAIAHRSDSEMYVFKGDEYVKMDLYGGEMTDKSYPRKVADDFNLPTELANCGEISAAEGQTNVLGIYCKSIYGYVTYDPRWTTDDSIRSMSDWGRDAEDVTAVYTLNGYIYFFTVKSRVSSAKNAGTTGSKSVFVASKVQDLDAVDAQSCYDEDCHECADDKAICTKCVASATLWGTRCLPKRVVLYLDFDNSEGTNSVDHMFVDGGQATLDAMTYTSDGATGSGMVFDGSTKLDLIPLSRGDDDTISEFEVTLRFKPDAMDNDRLLTIDDEAYVALVRKDDDDDTRVEFGVGNNTFIALADTPVVIGEWNTIMLKYTDDTFTVTVNGDRVSQAYSDWSGTDVSLRVDSWSLGADENGVVGTLDQVYMREIIPDDGTGTTEAPSRRGRGDADTASSSVTSEPWFIALIVVLVAAVACAATLCYVRRQRGKATIAHQRLVEADRGAQQEYVSFDDGL